MLLLYYVSTYCYQHTIDCLGQTVSDLFESYLHQFVLLNDTALTNQQTVPVRQFCAIYRRRQSGTDIISESDIKFEGATFFNWRVAFLPHVKPLII